MSLPQLHEKELCFRRMLVVNAAQKQTKLTRRQESISMTTQQNSLIVTSFISKSYDCLDPDCLEPDCPRPDLRDPDFPDPDGPDPDGPDPDGPALDCTSSSSM